MNEQAAGVEVRLRALERRVAQTTAVAMALLVGLASCIALSATQASDQVLRAKRIELIDSAGRVRMVLAAELDGPRIAGLEISGAENEASLRVYAGTFANESGGEKRIVSMVEVESDAGDGFAIAHLGALDQAASVSASFDDQRSIDLFASESSAEISLGNHEDVGDESTVELRYLPLIRLSEKDGTPSLRIQDPKGTTLFEKP